jgi:protein PhnA
MSFQITDGAQPQLLIRSAGLCDLCRAASATNTGRIEGSAGSDGFCVLCESCAGRLKGEAPLMASDWRGLQDAVWSDIPPVKVLAVVILEALRPDNWAANLCEQVWLEESERSFAQALARQLPFSSGARSTSDRGISAGEFVVKDSNGLPLGEGDSVTLIKDLEVKGAGFTAKRGTLVKGISLTGDPKFVEGKVNGIRIVLVAAYLKKVVS